jgi:hypothetical protein
MQIHADRDPQHSSDPDPGELNQCRFVLIRIHSTVPTDPDPGEPNHCRSTSLAVSICAGNVTDFSVRSFYITELRPVPNCRLPEPPPPIST